MEIKITGKKIAWGIIVIVVLIAIGAGVWMAIENANNPNGPSPYSAVYLTSGDIYFGKLSWFPQPHLTDVWYLQRTTGADGQTQVSVQPLKNVFWGPMNDITLNANQILFTARLNNMSQLVSGFENPPSSEQSPATVVSPTSTVDINGSSAGSPTKEIQ
jgi:hypothetical protein